MENFFHHIINLHQNIKFTIEEESNEELVFFSHFIETKYWRISVLVLRKPTNTDLYYSSHHQTGCKESVFSLFSRAYSIVTNEDDLTKENARVKQVLKENGYQERIISKIVKIITNNYSLSQSQQQAHATCIHEEEIRSHKIRSTFYAENTLRKLFCKPKDRVATEDKNIAYEINFNNCKAVYFGEPKRSLKMRSDEHKRSVKNYNCEKNEIVKHCWEEDHNFSWDQKEVVDRESSLIPRMITETIHFSKNLNHLDKISYMLLEIWLPNLW